MASSASAGPQAYPSGGEPYRHPRHGMVTFAAVMLFVLALFNGLDGIAAINQSRVFIADATYVAGDLLVWGWVVLALGILQGLAGFSVLTGGQAGRWFGVTVLGLNAFAHMWFVPAFPLWSVVIIALDIVAIYGLAAYGGPLESSEAAARHRAFTP